LQEHPDIEARIGFDDQVVGHAGVVMVVAQTETANHGSENNTLLVVPVKEPAYKQSDTDFYQKATR
jgi:hypothetical protein